MTSPVKLSRRMFLAGASVAFVIAAHPAVAQQLYGASAVGDMLRANIVPSTALTPALIQNSVDLSTFPGVSLGIQASDALRTVNGTALSLALAYCEAKNLYARAPAGIYDYIATNVQGSRNVGLQVTKGIPGLIGAGANPVGGTVFINSAVNHPVLTLGDMGPNNGDSTYGGTYVGIMTAHGVDQTGQASAQGILFGRIWGSYFNDLGNWPDIAGTNHAYVGMQFGDAGGSTQFFFSNTVGTLVARGGQVNCFKWNSGSTGTLWGNLYGGGGTFGSRVALSGPCYHWNAPGSEFGTAGQLNAEWVSCAQFNPVVFFDSCDGALIDHFHGEGLKMNGFDPIVISASVARVTINSVKLLDTWNVAANASDALILVKGYGNCRVEIGRLYCKWNGSGFNAEAVSTLPIQLYKDDATVVGRKPFIEIRNVDLVGHAGAFNLDATLTGAAPGSAGSISSIQRYVFDKSRSFTEGATIQMVNADMTLYRAHRKALVQMTATLTANHTLTISDKEAASGAGATLTLTDDRVDVERIGAGAFDLVVKDPAATTLYTFSGAASANTEKSFDVNGATITAI